MSPLVWRFLADLTVAAHLGYVAFVILGQLLIVLGMARRWEWIRNVPFRIVHLLAILIVVAEAWAGITCPLTTWENDFRRRAGQVGYQGDFIANAMHELLFFDAPPAVFTACYTAFGLLVAASFWYAPP